MQGKSGRVFRESMATDRWLALPYALPAVAAGLAYLNARHAVAYDWALLKPLLSAQLIRAALHDRRDDINLFYVLESHALGARADHTWIIFQGKHYTYAQSYETVLKYGTWLKSKGVVKDEIVAMDFMNSEIFIWIWFGLWSIGAKPAFINYNLTGKPLLHTIRASSARLVLVDQEGKDKFSEDVMVDHGFVSKPSDQRIPEGRQANYGFESEPSDIPTDVKKRLTASAQPSGTNGKPVSRQLEIIFFDKGLEDYIQSLQPIRQPNSERGNQQRHDMACLIYTSGTTGLPKAAVMAWGKANLGPKFVSELIPLRPDDVTYTSMPLYHSSASILGVGPALHAGTAVCLSKKFSHKTFWPEAQASNATILQYVGETCRYLLSAPKTKHEENNKIRCAFGNGLRPDVWEPFKERFGIDTIVEFYAATEAPTALWNRSTNTFSAGAIARNGTIASFLMSVNMSLVKLDPNTDNSEPIRDSQTGLCQIAGQDEPGELLVKLDANNISTKFQGYFGNKKATNSKVIRNVKKKGDAFFRTGDLMRRDKEGRWYFMDRLGDTFRWKAENVSTAEVADMMGKHDAIEEAAVYGVQIPRHDGRAGCAVIVLKNGESAGTITEAHPQTLKSLAEHAKKSLPAFAVPLFIRITPSMHTTGTNKQQKHLFQKDGIDIDAVEQSGDALFWLKDGTYEKFTHTDLDRIQEGQVKL
jgi:acyl-CoA synthetase (AMP-forming)/AMP-acid ligase II